MVAVIIPAYNQPQQLREALYSLTQQTNKRFFCVVCDDSSTEPLKEVCDEFLDRLSLVYLRTSINSGPGGARQLGLDWAINHNIELIMFMDSDDLLMPQAVETLSYEINHGRYDFVKSDILVEHKFAPNTIIEADESITWFHGAIYRTQFLKQHNIKFVERLRTNEDLAFNLSCYWDSQNCAYIHNTVYLWRDNQNSLTRSKGKYYNDAMGADYVRAVYYALKHVINNKEIQISNCLTNLLICYNYYQMCLIRNEKIAEEVDQMLSELFNNSRIFNALKKDKKLWSGARQRIFSYIIDDNKELIFFRETFGEWLKRYNKELIKFSIGDKDNL